MAVRKRRAAQRSPLPANVRLRLRALEAEPAALELAELACLLDGSVRRELRGDPADADAEAGTDEVCLRTPRQVAPHGEGVRSRRYLQNRVWRLLRRLAAQAPQQYVDCCELLLLRYTDKDLSNGVALLDSYVLTHVLFHDSAVVRCSSSGWVLAVGRELSELVWSPAFAVLWQSAQALEVLWRLSRTAPSRVVRRWAAQGLQTLGLEALQASVAELVELFEQRDGQQSRLACQILLQTRMAATLTQQQSCRLLAGFSVEDGEILLSCLRECQVEPAISVGLLQALVLAQPLVGLADWAWERLRERVRTERGLLLSLLDCPHERICDAIHGCVNEDSEWWSDRARWLQLLGVRSAVAIVSQLNRLVPENSTLPQVAILMGDAEVRQATWLFWRNAVDHAGLRLEVRRQALLQALHRVRRAPEEVAEMEAVLRLIFAGKLVGLREFGLLVLATGVRDGWITGVDEFAGVGLVACQ
ncbi:MAG TPA: hypothetical protein DIT89_17060 [Planctomycetaceae bacterium]|nr:hypothetical protein [Planctomycetaceae bacterium]